MKQIEKIAAGANFNAVSVGKSDELNDYVMELGSGVKIPGKVFGGTAVQATGSEFSFQSFMPGTESGFLHIHRITRNSTSSSAGRANSRWTGRSSPYPKGVSCGLPRQESARYATTAPGRSSCSACSTKAALSPPKMPPTASYCRNLSSGDIPNRNMGRPARLRAFRIFRYSLISLPGANRQRRDSNNADSTPVTP